MSEWIKCSDQLPPKEGKFLFHYHCGIGLGNWSRIYCFQLGGHSYLSDQCKYCLILWPSEHAPGTEDDAMEWDEDKMIEMGVSWMPLPEMPNPLKFPNVERIDLSCPECDVPLMACNPPTIGQCSECATIWELPKPPECKENE